MPEVYVVVTGNAYWTEGDVKYHAPVNFDGTVAWEHGGEIDSRSDVPDYDAVVWEALEMLGVATNDDHTDKRGTVTIDAAPTYTRYYASESENGTWDVYSEQYTRESLLEGGDPVDGSDVLIDSGLQTFLVAEARVLELSASRRDVAHPFNDPDDKDFITSTAASLMGDERDDDSINPEYARAILELCSDLLGYREEDRGILDGLIREKRRNG